MASWRYGIIAQVKFKLIESPKNPLVKRVVDIRDRKTRRSEFMIEGPHLVQAALDAGAVVKQVFFAGVKYKSLLKQLSGVKAEIYEVSDRVFNKLSDTETPQGILAIVALKPATLDTLYVKSPMVVLDGVQDPGNVGTIIRTADASGAGAVILLQGTCDALSQKALRASSGSIFSVPVIKATRKAIADELRNKGFRIVVTAVDAELSIFNADLGGPLALVLGNETKGVSPELKRAADLLVKIPVRGGAESLNVASSAAVALYEALRRS
jgi:TrmH family RNA methyltransferase